MGWQALLFYVFLAGFCFGAKGEDLPDALKNVGGFLMDRLIQQTCHWPAHIGGQWETSLWGNITVSGTKIHTHLSLGGTGVNEMQCHMSSRSGETVLRSKKTVHQGGQEFELFTCIEFVARNEHNYHVIVKSGRDASLQNEPLKRRAVQDKSEEKSEFSSCDKGSSAWLHGDMIRRGKVESAAVACPPALIGNFSVTFGDEAEMSQCPHGAVMTSGAASSGLVVFDYSRCSHGDRHGNEDTEVFWCIGNTPAGISMYQGDGDMGSFSCVTVQADSANNDTMVFTQTPGDCGDAWVLGSDISKNKQIKIAFLTPINNTEESAIPETASSTELAENKTSHAIHNNTGSQNANISIWDEIQGGQDVNSSWRFSVTIGNITEKQDFLEDKAGHLVPGVAVFIFSLAVVVFLV